MENSNEEILEIVKKLMEVKSRTTEEVLANATSEQLKEYIKLSEEIEAKMMMLLEK